MPKSLDQRSCREELRITTTFRAVEAIVSLTEMSNVSLANRKQCLWVQIMDG